MAAMCILRPWCVAQANPTRPQDAILTRKWGAIEGINGDLEVRVGEVIISMAESFEERLSDLVRNFPHL